MEEKDLEVLLQYDQKLFKHCYDEMCDKEKLNDDWDNMLDGFNKMFKNIVLFTDVAQEAKTILSSTYLNTFSLFANLERKSGNVMKVLHHLHYPQLIFHYK